MKNVTIKNVVCWGDLYEDCGVLVKTCETCYVIEPKANWTKTVNYLLEDPVVAKLANNGELELEVD